MMQHVLIGIGAGAASALLSVAGAFGPPPAILLAVFAGLPIMIVAIGWSHFAALVAVAATFAGLFAMLNFTVAAMLTLTVGVPAWFLGYLALLARPGSAPGTLEWYPVGHLVLWAALVGAATVVLALASYGLDKETMFASLRENIAAAIRIRPSGAAETPDDADVSRAVDILASLMPYAAALTATLVNLLNLWLAGLIVRISGRLRRPWPDIAAMRFPRYALTLAFIAVALAFLPGIGGVFARIFAVVLIVAFGMLGLAILHTVTRGARIRGAILATTYGAVLVLGWPILIASVAGMADTVFDLRARFAARRGTPPAPHP